jgi:hypothetical protein
LTVDARQGRIHASPSAGVEAVSKFFKEMSSNLGVAGEVVQFLWSRKRWWLIPLVVALLLFAIVMVFATASGVAPFIYTLF